MSLSDKEYQPEPIKDENGTIHEPEVFTIGSPETWQRVSPEYCKVHNLVPDPSEREFEAVKCTNCPYASLLKRKEPVS